MRPNSQSRHQRSPTVQHTHKEEPPTAHPPKRIDESLSSAHIKDSP